MRTLLNSLIVTPERLFLLSSLISAALLAGAHGFEHFGHLAPCLMCLEQREVHWLGGSLALALFMAGLFGLPRRWLLFGLLVLVLTYFYSAGLGFFHAGVEQGFWKGPAACAAVNVQPMEDPLSLDMGEIYIGPSCEEVPWQMLGISMAGYNGLISLALALLLGFGLWHHRRPPTA